VATFSAQVVDLVGTFSDETALDSFITEGANEVINAMPRSMQERVAEETSFTNTTTSEGSKVLHVLRNDGTIDQPCRKVPARNRGRIQDSSDMQYATATDPAYYVQDALVTIFPTGTGKLVSIPTYNQGSALDASSLSTITNFPNEAEYLVTLYAAIKALQQNMSGMMTLTAIDTTALGAITTELNKADDIINTAHGKIGDFYTSIGDIDDTTELWDNTNKRFTVVRDALVYAANLIDGNKPDAAYDVAQNLLDVNAAFDGIQAHLADGEAILTNDPTSGDIATALTAMKNAIEAAEATFDKMEDSASSVFGDSDTFTAASSQLTRVKAAIDNAEDVINSNQPSAATDAYGAQSNEDIELVTSALNIAQTEIQRAQMHLSEWTSIGDMRVKQINASLSEAQAYGGEIQARLSYASAYQQASAARGQEGQNRIAQANTTLSVAQQELARANAAIAEINVLMGSYRLELEGVGPYLQAATGYISQAQGYVAEANTRMQREEQKYKWYQAQQAKLQADYDRGIQLLARG
tara:strand:+ start:3192 stop:4769 length:1578 start_codon:yes stop_codon:yes gene_type:complete